MSLVSYAQNYEDVMLWRALRDIEKGFYIDVGAWSPDLDSVTKAFSERGWRGINIEPNPVYLTELVQRRPNDINLGVAVGDHQGEISMSFIPDSGLSTADEKFIRDYEAAGYKTSLQSVELSTLSAIWTDHLSEIADVHFLKVDVEGLERAVLAGNDWTRFRPWIVVVEATVPTSQIENYEGWEYILLQAGYLHVYSDGLNRYYVAREHPERIEAFKYPPNVFDDFVPVSLVDALQKFEQTKGALHAAEQHIARDAQTLAQAQERVATVGQKLGEAEGALHAAEQHIARDAQTLAQAQERVAAVEQKLGEAEGAVRAAQQRTERDAQMLAEAQQRATLVERQLAEAKGALHETKTRIEATERRALQRERTLLATTANLENLVAQADARASIAIQQASVTAQRYEAILRSKSWWLTAPLRGLSRRVSNALGWLRGVAKQMLRPALERLHRRVRQYPSVKRVVWSLASLSPSVRKRLIRFAQARTPLADTTANRGESETRAQQIFTELNQIIRENR